MGKILIINGPNLNLVGTREPEIYGKKSLTNYLDSLKQEFSGKLVFDVFQSNHEGELIDKIQESDESYSGIILNAGAYTHTSLAIADAVAAIKTPVVEVHISNTFSRESHRRHSYIATYCRGIIAGFGLDSYRMALMSFLEQD